ncbi:intraflagellar transport 46, partial [Brachionus plicatilis]
MADDSDEEQQRIIENQHYDELLEVADGEEVPSIYTPTPRNPRTNQQPSYSRSHLYPQQVTHPRNTPPPSSSSLSSHSQTRDPGLNNLQRMSEPQSETQSPVETPKFNLNESDSNLLDTEIRHSQLQQNAIFSNNIIIAKNNSNYHQMDKSKKNSYKTPMSTPSLVNEKI